MSNIALLAHIPLLRTVSEEIPFAGGSLWQMPFEIYNHLSMGAFEDHKKNYELTAPVFYRTDIILDDPMIKAGTLQLDRVLEIKANSSDWEFLNKLGMGLLYRFQVLLVDKVWSALMLTAPAAAYLDPRISVSFAQCTDESYFHLNEDLQATTLRVQGDADQEYLFLPDVRSEVMEDEDIARASNLFSTIELITKEPELVASLRSLLSIGSPTLTKKEQLSLTTIALENLLLPEIRSGLERTFSKRIGGLLSTNDHHRKKLQKHARNLYRLRSAYLHGKKEEGKSDASQALLESHGPQLLAATILEFSKRLTADISMQEIRELAEKEDCPHNPYWGQDFPLVKPPASRATHRIGPSKPNMAASITSGANMSSAEGTIMAWSPLIGLIVDESYGFGEGKEKRPPVLMPLSNREIVSLEEKDISRDFINKLSIIQKRGASVLMTFLEKDLDSSNSYSYELLRDHLYNPPGSMLLRNRDLATVGLRLAGMTKFYDPELLGSYIYDQHTRFRQSSVLRQTLLMSVGADSNQHESISPEGVAKAAKFWKILQSYDTSARHEDIEHVLTLFRRGFDIRFLPIETSTILHISSLEAMLGRFRKFDDPIQLEDLVHELVKENKLSAQWFSQHGRKFRNELAHGNWQASEEGLHERNHLIAIIQEIIPQFISFWISQAQQSDKRPGAMFINHLNKQLKN